MTKYILIGTGILLLLGVIIPLFNRWQFGRLPIEQQIRVLMKQANKLIYFKNIANGRSGTLIYIKNKRKIYLYPWELKDGQMVCTRKPLFTYWDYPQEQPAFSDEEIAQARAALDDYNKKRSVKLLIDDEAE